jgi:hypothetical protein
LGCKGEGGGRGVMLREGLKEMSGTA